MRTTIALLATVLVGLTSGCGTVCNLASDNPQPYGGVTRDLDFLAKPGHLGRSNNGTGAALVLSLWGADVCVSAVCDTLTYPLFVLREGQKREAERAIFDDPSMTVQYSCGAVASPP
jgi:uncharacterized protein YceK